MKRSRLFNPYGGLRKPRPYRDDEYSMHWNREDLNTQFVNAMGTPVTRQDYKPEDVKPPKGAK